MSATISREVGPLSIRQACILVGWDSDDEDTMANNVRRLRYRLRKEGALFGGGGKGSPCWTTARELERLRLITYEPGALSEVTEALAKFSDKLEAIDERLNWHSDTLREVVSAVGSARLQKAIESQRRREEAARY